MVGLQADVNRLTPAGSLKRAAVRLIGKTGAAPGVTETLTRELGAGRWGLRRR